MKHPSSQQVWNAAKVGVDLYEVYQSLEAAMEDKCESQHEVTRASMLANHSTSLRARITRLNPKSNANHSTRLRITARAYARTRACVKYLNTPQRLSTESQKNLVVTYQNPKP